MMDVAKLKQKILDLAIRGKLVPQDPNDEPASVLIEKIRTEKEELIRQGKIKRDKNESYIFKGDDNSYYEKVDGETHQISFKEPLNTTGCIWLKGDLLFLPMETVKALPTPCFEYIDIDAIDNKQGIIKSPKQISTIDAPSRARRKVFNGSTLFSMVRPYLRNIAYVDKENASCIASTGFYVCTPQPFVLPKYLYYLMNSSYVVNGINFFMKGDNSPSVRAEQIESFLFPIPSLSYQKKTIIILEKLFEEVNKIDRSINELHSLVKQLKCKILDCFFGKNSRYKSYYGNELKLGDILQYEQPAKYIVNSTDYSDEYATPVLTPGKTFVLGYTNEKDGIYRVNDKKVIIFDDFTTASRLIDFDFKVKSSAMKILTVSDEDLYDTEYMYLLLQTIHINNNTHKRYWISDFATQNVKIHSMQEQKKIVQEITKIYMIIEKVVG